MTIDKLQLSILSDAAKLFYKKSNLVKSDYPYVAIFYSFREEYSLSFYPMTNSTRISNFLDNCSTILSLRGLDGYEVFDPNGKALEA